MSELELRLFILYTDIRVFVLKVEIWIYDAELFILSKIKDLISSNNGSEKP